MKVKSGESHDAVLDRISDHVFELDQGWRFTWFNKSAEAQLRRLGPNPATIEDVTPREPAKADPPKSLGAMDLSQRQEELLRDCASGYANQDIATRLGISVRTVEVHKARGMRKGEHAQPPRHGPPCGAPRMAAGRLTNRRLPLQPIARTGIP